MRTGTCLESGQAGQSIRSDEPACGQTERLTQPMPVHSRQRKSLALNPGMERPLCPSQACNQALGSYESWYEEPLTLLTPLLDIHPPYIHANCTCPPPTATQGSVPWVPVHLTGSACSHWVDWCPLLTWTRWEKRFHGVASFLDRFAPTSISRPG